MQTFVIRSLLVLSYDFRRPRLITLAVLLMTLRGKRTTGGPIYSTIPVRGYIVKFTNCLRSRLVSTVKTSFDSPTPPTSESRGLFNWRSYGKWLFLIPPYKYGSLDSSATSVESSNRKGLIQLQHLFLGRNLLHIIKPPFV